jgi:hypothetical protein
LSGGIKAVGKGVSGGIRAVNNGVVETIDGVKHGVTGGISRVSTGVSSSLNTVKSTAKVLTNFVTDQRLKDCLLQTVCYLTPLTEEEEEVVGFEGRKKTKEQRKKNKEAKKKEKKKNKKEKKKKIEREAKLENKILDKRLENLPPDHPFNVDEGAADDLVVNSPIAYPIFYSLTLPRVQFSSSFPFCFSSSLSSLPPCFSFSALLSSFFPQSQPPLLPPQ